MILSIHFDIILTLTYLATVTLFSSDKSSRTVTSYSTNKAKLYQIGPLWDLAVN